MKTPLLFTALSALLLSLVPDLGAAIGQTAFLKASNTGFDDQLGRSVAMSGNTIVVGAPGESSSAMGVNGNQADNGAPYSGAAYVYVFDGGNWVLVNLGVRSSHSQFGLDQN